MEFHFQYWHNTELSGAEQNQEIKQSLNTELSVFIYKGGGVGDDVLDLEERGSEQVLSPGS